MTEQEYEDRRFDKGSRVSERGLVYAILIGVVALLWGMVQCAHAETVTLRCTEPTKNVDGSPLTNLAGIRWLYGASATALTPVKTTPTCATTIDNLTVGTWYFAEKAINSVGVESALSNIVSWTVPQPPVALTLKVIEPAVYNTGSFSPTAWLVRRNKLYGTIPLDTLCDESKPAADGYYRVPSASVRWTNSLAKTPYPLAKCALR